MLWEYLHYAASRPGWLQKAVLAATIVAAAQRAGDRKRTRQGRAMKNQLNEFKKFIMRGNVVDLAVAVVIGTAFSAAVTALVNNMLTPLIAAVVGKPDFSNLLFTVNNSQFKYGIFLNALIAFVSVAVVVFFFVVQPLNKLQAFANRNEPSDDPTTKKCPECLSEIPKDALRCAFCTARQPEAEAIAKTINKAAKQRAANEPRRRR